MNQQQIAKILDREATPLMLLEEELWRKKGIKVWLKRDDLLCIEPNNAFVGNKWRKMKYNLIEAATHNWPLLTFGGAYSNHIAATAAAGKALGFKTIGVIRGEETLPLNDTLAQAVADGMQLYYVSRSDYRQKHTITFQQNLEKIFGAFYLIPEGGSNALALDGCMEISREISEDKTVAPTHICSACGTGGTLAGIVLGASPRTKVVGFAALKGGFHQEEVNKLLAIHGGRYEADWEVVDDYHFGGFAKYNAELVNFINTFKTQHGIQLEPLYTGKMLYGIYDMIANDKFAQGSQIVVVHTGGLQGIKGFNQRYQNKGEIIE